MSMRLTSLGSAVHIRRVNLSLFSLDFASMLTLVTSLSGILSAGGHVCGSTGMFKVFHCTCELEKDSRLASVLYVDCMRLIRVCRDGLDRDALG